MFNNKQTLYALSLCERGSFFVKLNAAPFVQNTESEVHFHQNASQFFDGKMHAHFYRKNTLFFLKATLFYGFPILSKVMEESYLSSCIFILIRDLGGRFPFSLC